MWGWIVKGVHTKPDTISAYIALFIGELLVYLFDVAKCKGLIGFSTDQTLHMMSSACCLRE